MEHSRCGVEFAGRRAVVLVGTYREDLHVGIFGKL